MDTCSTAHGSIILSGEASTLNLPLHGKGFSNWKFRVRVSVMVRVRTQGFLKLASST